MVKACERYRYGVTSLNSRERVEACVGMPERHRLQATDVQSVRTRIALSASRFVIRSEVRSSANRLQQRASQTRGGARVDGFSIRRL